MQWNTSSSTGTFCNVAPTTPATGLPCDHGTARPHVADGKDGLQILKVAATVLHSKSPRAERRTSRFGATFASAKTIT